MIVHGIHFWQLGHNSDRNLELEDYYTPPAYMTGFTSTTNVVLEISRFSFPKTFFDLKRSVAASGWYPIVHPEQKSVTVTRHILQEFTKNGDMIFDPCMGIGATARTCILETKNRKFIGFDSDSKCAEKMMPSLLETFAIQV